MSSPLNYAVYFVPPFGHQFWLTSFSKLRYTMSFGLNSVSFFFQDYFVGRARAANISEIPLPPNHCTAAGQIMDASLV